MSTISRIDHAAEFARAWADDRFTRFELPAVDVNCALASRYRTSRPLTFTRAMLWDVEVRKASHPDRYIPYVIREGSASTWGWDSDAVGTEFFVRSSRQRLWLAPEKYGVVLEQTHLDFARQRVTFIGAAEIVGADGEIVHADTGQPLFHVEHSVGGEEAQPLNQWRIVHLTDGPDERLNHPFTTMGLNPWLAEFVEIYIRSDLHIELTRIED